MTVTVLDTSEGEKPRIQTSSERERIPTVAPRFRGTADRLHLSQLLSPERIVIWNEPVRKEALLRGLVKTFRKSIGGRDPSEVMNAIFKREEQGSTFFNEGAAFPHARIDGLPGSCVSLGLPRQGVSDEPTEKPIELVFLILSPAENPDEQIKILALASHAAQSRRLLQSLGSARSPQEAMTAIQDWEELHDSNKPKSS